MIQPPPVEDVSPIDSMVATIQMMVKNRMLVLSMPVNEYMERCIDDCSILVAGPTMSCKSSWSRGVASPLFAAYRIMHGQGDEKDRAVRAIRVLTDCCSDLDIMRTCCDWLRTHHGA